MRLLIVFIGFALAGACNSVFANDDIGHNRFQSFVSVLGPVSVGPDQYLKVCSTDISVITKLGARDKEKPLSKRYYDGRTNTGRVVWSSTRIEVFDSVDTTRPLPLAIEDIIFSSGKGACTSIPGYDMGADGLSRSVVIVLTTLTEARAVFSPLVSGQLIAPNNPPGIALLVPAVQAAEDSGSGGSNSCCACVPVCGCGICN